MRTNPPNKLKKMSDYKRLYKRAGSYFFTVVTHNRQRLLTGPANIERLREAFRQTQNRHPFILDAVVVLPEHIHCIWQMPGGDEDFSTRWRLIKRHFSIGIDNPLNQRKEKQVWQRRFWEHLLRDEDDWRRHMDYIHYNPVKHGYAQRPVDWPHSSFMRAVEGGYYSADWGAFEPHNIRDLKVE